MSLSIPARSAPERWRRRARPPRRRCGQACHRARQCGGSLQTAERGLDPPALPV